MKLIQKSTWEMRVKEAYEFLVHNYDDGIRDNGPDELPDQIYLIGFSRGAYTARVLAGFLHAVGLIAPINLNLLNYAYRAYKGVNGDRTQQDNTARDPDNNPFAEVRLFERMLTPKRPAIKCLGLFDTVGSVIELGRYGPRLKSHAFTKTNRSVENIFHAVAIDEKRTMFQPQLWPVGGQYWPKRFVKSSAKAQNVKEVWFSGVHGDIGGGYPEERSALAKLSLEWMIKEMKTVGMQFKTCTINGIVLGKNEKKSYVKPNALAPRNESMNAVWSILEFIPRRIARSLGTRRMSVLGFYIPFFESRIISDTAVIHSSVHQRRGTPQDYDQPNLP